MKALFVLTLLLSASAAHAISDEKLITKCAPVAYLKILGRSKELKCPLIKDTFAAINIDNRTLNPYKYVMYQADTECQDIPTITAVTQYSATKKDCY
ncbi:hypothetical protein DOM21_11190 [Bacteriovorax stolpii]|uniref:hypothetical protein n=1 Tax=Bacteriovorax stolpii TaxID=960 RepID=UPI00115A7BE4|nr:hypothetical protein [Bacteriovorax stolpii]QDK42000.1 hypothetical protein DOM21_11190 [Bacteriovorax stolpii]BDT28111.1 hypothetical protein BHI3_15770 [Bacteriovorax sp. HI3]